jgi:hypothetical protein
MPNMLELKTEADPIKKTVLTRVWLIALFIWCPGVFVFGQETGGGIPGTEGNTAMSRGSIPQELLRPRRDESPRYPVDTVIGALGRGEASAEAFAFARRVASALTGGVMSDSSLSAINTVMLESYMSALGEINPRSFRLGGGREEVDGTFSFLIRFVGREQSITGELFVRYERRKLQAERPAAQEAGEEAPAASNAGESAPAEIVETVPVMQSKSEVWVFDELILEEARSRQSENEEVKHRFDFPPYERLF